MRIIKKEVIEKVGNDFIIEERVSFEDEVEYTQQFKDVNKQNLLDMLPNGVVIIDETKEN